MQYQSIILELMTRIQKLEEEVSMLKQQVNIADTCANQENASVEGTTLENIPVQYQKMTNEMIIACYEGGKKLLGGENASDVADKIVEETGMNKNSAIMYVYAVHGMLEGTVYKRAISAKAMKKYFDTILSEYGRFGLQKAIKATRLHVAYRRECGHVVDSIEEICDSYEKKMSS